MLLTIIVLFSLILLSGCSSSVDEAPIEQKSRVTIDLSTFQVEVEDMGGGSRAALSTAATRLSFAVLNTQGNSVKTIHQNSEKANFGKIQMELNSGTYTMVAVAHKGEYDAFIQSDESVTIPGTTFTDTFVKVQSLTVVSNQDCDCSMTLNRITSAFILSIIDVDQAPDNVKNIEVVINTRGTLLSELNPPTLNINPSTGLALNNLKFIYTIPFADISEGIPFYYIGMNSSATVTVKATAKDENGTEIISHTISNVPLKVNQKTIATGNFFTPKVSGEFTVDNEWLNDNNIEY